MDPATLAILTAAVPFLTGLVKKWFGTTTIVNEDLRRGVHTVLPLLLGMISSGAHAYATGGDLVNALAVGLAAGGIGSSARDLDKNLVGLAQAVSVIVSKKRISTDGSP